MSLDQKEFAGGTSGDSQHSSLSVFAPDTARVSIPRPPPTPNLHLYDEESTQHADAGLRHTLTRSDANNHDAIETRHTAVPVKLPPGAFVAANVDSAVELRTHSNSSSLCHQEQRLFFKRDPDAPRDRMSPKSMDTMASLQDHRASPVKRANPFQETVVTKRPRNDSTSTPIPNLSIFQQADRLYQPSQFSDRLSATVDIGRSIIQMPLANQDHSLPISSDHRTTARHSKFAPDSIQATRQYATLERSSMGPLSSVHYRLDVNFPSVKRKPINHQIKSTHEFRSTIAHPDTLSYVHTQSNPTSASTNLQGEGVQKGYDYESHSLPLMKTKNVQFVQDDVQREYLQPSSTQLCTRGDNMPRILTQTVPCGNSNAVTIYNEYDSEDDLYYSSDGESYDSEELVCGSSRCGNDYASVFIQFTVWGALGCIIVAGLVMVITYLVQNDIGGSDTPSELIGTKAMDMFLQSN